MKKRLPILLLVVAVLAGAVWAFHQARTASQPDGATFYGNVDLREVNLGFRVAGKVAKVTKEEGDSVPAGAVVAELDPEPLRQQLEQARANLASLRAVLELKRHGNRPEEIAVAAAGVAELQATVANADTQLARQQELVKTRAVSREALDNAEAGQREARARLHSAEANLQLEQAGFRAEEIAQAEANVAQAEAAVRSAETNLADSTLVAPERGVVITRAVEPGSIVTAGTTALTVNLQDRVWVRAYVSEPFLGRVQPGRAVELYTDLHPQKPYHGQIGYVSPRAEFTPKSVETKDLRTALVYRFRVVVSDPDPDLRQGMPVTLRLVP